MSKLAELIEKFCPNGVEYKELNEIAHYAKKRINATEINENTYVGVENLLQNKQGKTISSSVPNNGKVIQFEKGDIVEIKHTYTIHLRILQRLPRLKGTR